MIIYSGWGILILPLGLACLLVTQLGVNAVMQDGRYYQDHPWCRLVALWLAAAAAYPLGRRLNRKAERRLLDPDTLEPVVIRSANHSFFFVPVQHWWIVLLVLGVVAAST